MRRVLLCIMLLPTVAFAATFTSPENGREVITIDEPLSAEKLFGRLEGFPHTFSFALAEPHDFKASIYVHDSQGQKNDVSIILVRQEKRGVLEIGRTSAKAATWESKKSLVLAESFRNGGSLDVALEPGSYILEVSAPDNDGVYQLAINPDNGTQGYFENLTTLFKLKELLGAPWYSVFVSPLVYVPLFVFCLLLLVLLYVRKRYTQ